MTYKLQANGNIQRIEDGAYVPVDPNNRDYQDFLAWQAAGNVPQQDPVVPPSVLSQLYVTDYHMARIGEDILDVLTSKGVLKLLDLPLAAQQIITTRKTLRAQLGAPGQTD